MFRNATLGSAQTGNAAPTAYPHSLDARQNALNDFSVKTP